MSDQLKAFEQPTLWDEDTATGSPELAAGAKPSDSPDGPSPEKSGRVRARVNRFRVPENAEARRTNGTSGRNFTVSSASADLQRSLASRLQAQTDLNGSMECRLTWRNSATPSLRRICRLRASARPTSDSDFSGSLHSYPTPKVGQAPYQYGQGDHSKKCLELPGVAKLAIHPTPDAQAFGTNDSRFLERREEIKATGINGNGFGLTLGMVASLAVHPTCKAKDGREWNPNAPPGSASGHGLGATAQMAVHATPTVHDAEKSDRGKKTDQEQYGTKGRPKGRQSIGAISPSSTTGTEKPGGVLNPWLSLWLMGYPSHWLRCGLIACAASRSRRGKSKGWRQSSGEPGTP